jgi:hypothetical protein
MSPGGEYDKVERKNGANEKEKGEQTVKIKRQWKEKGVN